MKNFTNNFKQFTSRLSARWLIMALMLLMGTSSAWAAIYLKGSFNGWGESNVFDGNGHCKITLSKGDYTFKIHDNGSWYGNGHQFKRDDCSNITVNTNTNDMSINVDADGSYDFYWNGYDKKLSVTYPPQCATCCDNNCVAGNIELTGYDWDPGQNEMTCSNNLYSKTFTNVPAGTHQFKITDGSWTWSTGNITAKSGSNYLSLSNDGSNIKFTTTSIYNITIYYDGNGCYATYESACETPKASNFTYEAPSDLTYSNSTKSATVGWNGTQGGSITVKYSSSSTKYTQAEPKNVGTYYVYVTTTEANGMCGVTDLYIGKSFDITKVNQTDDFEITNNQTTYCGFPASDIALTANGGSTTETVTYTSGDTNVATIVNSKLHAVGEGTVTITATRPGGTNYNDITATKSFTFYKAPNAPTVSVTNLIKCGDNTTDGVITLNNYNSNSNYTYSIVPNDEVGGDAQNGYQISIADNYTITVTRKVNETCSLSTPSATIPVVLTDNTPAATVSIADVAPICESGSATLTCNVTPTKGTVKSYTWTLPNESTQVTNTNTLSTGVIAEAGTYTYSVVVTLENNDCTKDLLPVSKSVTVKEAPTAPDFGGNNSQTVCQNTNVTLPEEFDDVQLKWYEYQNRTSPITSFPADAEKIVYAAAYNGTCESAELTAYTYNIYPVPNITVAPRTRSAMCYELVTVTATVTNRANGALVYWYEGNTQVGTGDEYTFTKTTTTTVSNLRAEIRNSVNCDPVSATVPAIKFTAHQNCGPSYVQGKILYFRPNGSWKEASARFAAYFYGNGNTWIDMTDGDNDGTYACEIPEGYPNVIFCRMDPGTTANNWDNDWAQTADLTIPDDSKRLYSFENITANDNWYPKDGKWSDLDSDKTFRTIAVNGNGLWNTGGASVYAHPWSVSDQSQGWFCMTPGIEAGIWLIDIETKYTDIVFERRDASGNQFDGGADKHKTADLKLDRYGNEFKILTYSGDAKTHGEWQWRWFQSTYDLGVQTNVVEQNGENLEIHCTGVVYKTSCAPGIKYGFEYATNEAMTNPIYVECGHGYIAAGASFEKYIDVEPGEYYVRAKVQYENNAAVYGGVKKVIIANNCDPDYEFTVGSTSAIVQACGGNRTLPAIEILTDKTPAGKTISWAYEWKNADGSAATNLSATNIPQPTFNGTTSQEYKVTIYKKVNNDIKCVQTAEYQVAYDDNSPKAVITAPTTVKINEAVTIQGAVHYTESFTWRVTEGVVDVTSTMLSDVNSLNPTFNTKEAGTYVITLIAAANLSCPADDVTHTITIEGPEEDCASGEIEIAVDLTNQGNFNTGNDVFIFDECTYITKLYKENTYIFTKEYIEENGYPKVMIASQQVYDGYYAYMKPTQLTEEDHLGKKVTFKFNNSAYQNQNNSICTYEGKNYNREYYDISVTTSDISNTVSAPTISSPKAVVNDDTKKATLSAYLAKTGCSAITKYGFQYIMSDTEPSESDWTNSSKTTTQDFTNNIVIGKTFKWETTDELEQGKYWFRAYAKNAAGKTSYTSPISFEIIADGPYPVFIDAVQGHESEAALYITNDGYVEVKIYNKGKDDDDDVLEGSYKLIIENQNQNILFTPLIKNTPIEHQSSVTFTSKDKVANLDHYNITATLTYKGRKDTRNISKCTPIKAAQDLDNNGLRDTIYYTIDAAAVTDKCMLVFPTVYEAVEHLKKSSEAEEDYQYTKKIGNGYILQQPVVMQVAYSTNRYKGNISVNTTGGGDKVSATIIPIININNDDDNGNCQGGAKYNIDNGNSDDVKYYSLTIRALNPNARPALQHLAIRDSRYITLDNLNLVASSTIKDNALDIDCNNNSWVGNVRGKFKNTYVTVKNCNITSKGFTCVHVSAVDQIHFLNNEITAELDDNDVDDDNVRCWGASVKFIRSENLSFIRNNFMGTHATSIWLQEVKGALFMNNVLWNNNKIEKDIFAMFRIVHQTGDYHPKNIGIYYNTLFLDNNGERSASPEFNFLTLNSNDGSNNDDAIAHDGTFDTETIEFMYNNCYSYDTRTPGRPDNPFKGREAWEGLCYNNFWSAKTGADFSFNGCSTIHNVNVEDNVCTTGATSPHSLVISGDKLNLGIKPATTLAVQLGANLLMSDRNRSNVRPETVTDDDLENYKGWTLGAYQQTAPEEVSTIIWQGEAGTDWDNRNNWIDADTKRVLTCTHELASNLRVIIPAPHSEKYQVPGEEGVVNYPVIPVFNTRNTTLYGSELVNAGQKVGGANSGKFAGVIEIEYGGSLQGVENLVDRYVEAKTNFTAGRDQWTLVGTVVKPWTDNTKKSTRNIKSGDYFIEKQTPHVYMHYAYMDGNTAKWSEPFTSKEEYLEVTDVMAINLPNQYGEYKLTSQDYYTYSPDKDPEKLNDNVVPKNYEFVGKFVNEASLPYITDLSNEPVLLNNSYPCNIDPKKLEEEQGTVWMYDYKGGSFSLTSDDDVLIKPQHGFIFKPTGGTYEVTNEMLVSGDTKSRSAEAEMPIFSLNLFNANSTEGEYSRVIVKYDELGDNGPVDLDLEKMFAENASTPELYIVMYDGKYQRVHVNSKEIVIPLGIRLMTSMNVSFQKFKAEGFDKVTLVDVVANKEYDLLSGKEVVTEKLLAGDIEGRFFLNLKETEEDDDIEGDDNVSTEIEEDSAEQSINILVEGENTVKVITNGVQLENIYVSDMTGRTVGYKASGYSAVVELPVAQGVYMINVIGDTASRTEKVILK